MTPFRIRDDGNPSKDGNPLDRVVLLGFLLFGEMDVQHAVLHFRVDPVGINIVRQQECLLERLIGEFAAEVLAVLSASFTLGIFHSSNFKVSQYSIQRLDPHQMHLDTCHQDHLECSLHSRIPHFGTHSFDRLSWKEPTWSPPRI